MSDSTTWVKDWLGELRRRKVVRVAIVYGFVAWLLIQVAAETFEPLGLPGWTLTFVIVLAALGLPLALVLAWAFDIGPHGIERTLPVARRSEARVERPDPSPAPVASDARPLPHGVAAAAGNSAAPVSQSVAILPFVDMSPERDQDYFCEGIAEEIINALCCVRDLKIASRTSAFQFKGRNDDVREIGRALGVSAVLEGSVRKSGDRLRINAQLVGTADGYHLWSETFDRRLEDVFTIQSEIAQQITRLLRTSLTGADAARLERGGTASSYAYEYYLRGRALLRRHGAARLQSRHMFRRAIEIDPLFALGHAGLAAALADEAFWRQVRDEKEIGEALQAVARAEQLQPGLVEVLVARGQLLAALDRTDEATASFDAAIERAPSFPDTYYFYARHAFTLGEHAKAVRLFERAIELEPTNYTAWGLLGQSYEVLGEDERARDAHLRCAELIDRQLELYPDDARAMQFGASANAVVGRRQRALDLIAGSVALLPDAPGTLYNCACAYARLNEPDKAFELLERWADGGSGGARWLREDPDLGPLRSDPRFALLMARIDRRGPA